MIFQVLRNCFRILLRQRTSDPRHGPGRQAIVPKQGQLAEHIRRMLTRKARSPFASFAIGAMTRLARPNVFPGNAFSEKFSCLRN